MKEVAAVRVGWLIYLLFVHTALLARIACADDNDANDYGQFAPPEAF